MLRIKSGRWSGTTEDSVDDPTYPRDKKQIHYYEVSVPGTADDGWRGVKEAYGSKAEAEARANALGVAEKGWRSFTGYHKRVYLLTEWDYLTPEQRQAGLGRKQRFLAMVAALHEAAAPGLLVDRGHGIEKMTITHKYGEDMRYTASDAQVERGGVALHRTAFSTQEEINTIMRVIDTAWNCYTALQAFQLREDNAGNPTY